MWKAQMKCSICGGNSWRGGNPDGTFPVLLKRRGRIYSSVWTKPTEPFPTREIQYCLTMGFQYSLRTLRQTAELHVWIIQCWRQIPHTRDAAAQTFMPLQCEWNQKTDQTRLHLAENTFPTAFWELQDFSARFKATKDSCSSLYYPCTPSHFWLDVGYCRWYWSTPEALTGRNHFCYNQHAPGFPSLAYHSVRDERHFHHLHMT